MDVTAQEPFRPRSLIRTVYAPSLLHAAGYGMLAPAVPLFASQLDITFGLIGLIVSMQGIGAMATDIPAGLLVTRVGGRTAMVIGICASALGAIVLGLSQTPAQLFVAVPLVGVGLATWATTRLAYVADVAPVEQRGRALALVGGAVRAGMTVGPILGGVIGEAFGIRAAFFGHAAMAALALTLMSTQRRESVVRPPSDGERAHTRVLRTVVDHRREFATAGSVAVALVMLRSTRRMLIPLWGAWLELDLTQIGLVIGLASAVDMTLFYPVGVGGAQGYGAFKKAIDALLNQGS